MNNPKMENLLNLALDATPEEREKSLELEVGYEPQEDTWELIVKYSGDIGNIELEYPQISIVRLSNEYAIITLPQPMIDVLVNRSEIEYIEKPKRLFFAINQGKRSSCIMSLYSGNYNLSGKGVLVAIIDSGIDYRHPDFCNNNGTTRIISIWDQTIRKKDRPEGVMDEWAPPARFKSGVEFTEAQINLALEQPTAQASYEICPSQDLSGHGTHVAGIAAGNGRASEGKNTGVAFDSSIIVVKLGTPRANSFPRTTELMQAIDYVVNVARDRHMPISVNVSFGNNYGSHDGTSLLETYISDISNFWKSCIVTGTGNEGASKGHTSGSLLSGTEEVEFSIGTFESSMNLQIWKSYIDQFSISITHPNGKKVGTIKEIQGTQRFTIENTQILLYYGEPSPYSPYQEIYLDFIPKYDYIDSGIWTLELEPERIVWGEYNMWMPSSQVLNAGTGFFNPTENTTLTIPSTAIKVISVGAYDSYYDQFASFSGRGYTRQTKLVKPDLCAPGVDIMSTAPGGGYTLKSGTSMATPFVTGGAALLMEWGIVNGNDPFLYGEKVKAYLIKGARQLPSMNTYPNPTLGWGTLCVRDSLPV